MNFGVRKTFLKMTQQAQTKEGNFAKFWFIQIDNPQLLRPSKVGVERTRFTFSLKKTNKKEKMMYINICNSNLKNIGYQLTKDRDP